MPSPRVRWSVRLPWSSGVRLRRLVQIDGPGRPGDICGRAVCHLLDQPVAVVAALVQQVAAARAAAPTDRTSVVSMRVDAAMVARIAAWLEAHPWACASTVADAAIRSYLHVCQSHTDVKQGGCGLAPRRYRRLCGHLVVIVDDAHAA